MGAAGNNIDVLASSNGSGNTNRSNNCNNTTPVNHGIKSAYEINVLTVQSPNLSSSINNPQLRSSGSGNGFL